MSQTLKRIPRGEMWLSNQLFKELGWQDDFAAHQRLCQELAMDILFLPIDFPNHQQFNYRFFSLDEAREILMRKESILVGLVIAGPFQRLAAKMGLESLLREWRVTATNRMLDKESVQVGAVISACLEYKPDVLVIADDIAYNLSTYINPYELDQSLFKFYINWLQQVHTHNVLAFFHSDGNLSTIIPSLVTCGFDGLAGCELECQDVPVLKRQYESKLTFLTGISVGLLEKEELSTSDQEQFIQTIHNLSVGGRFVLCSSCGLGSKKHLTRLRTLYRWTDEAWGQAPCFNLPEAHISS